MSQDLSFQLDTSCEAIQELQTRPHWVCYRKEIRNGRPTKIPYSPLNGRCAQSNNPATWSDYQTALEALSFYHCDGLGYMFYQDFTGVDLDHCVDADGVIEPWALKIIRFLDSYTEYSPSRSGVHILVRGNIPKGIRRFIPPEKHPQQEHAAIEMYCEKRYFTITGQHVPGTSKQLAARQAGLATLFKLVTQVDKPHPHLDSTSSGRTSQAVTTSKSSSISHPLRDHTEASSVQHLSNETILQRASAAANGERFQALYYRGDYSGYPSPSEADLALCNHLAFWTGCDLDRMDALFRQSGLFRQKWDSKRNETTYGHETLLRAIQHVRAEATHKPQTLTILIEHLEHLLDSAHNDELVEGDCQIEFQHANESASWVCRPRKVSLHEILSCLGEKELGDAQLFNEAFHHLAWFDFLQKDWYLWREHTWQRDLAEKSILLVPFIASYYRKAAVLLTARQDALRSQLEQIKSEYQFVGQKYIDDLTSAIQMLSRQVEELRKRDGALHMHTRMQNVLKLAQPLMTIQSQTWDQKPFLLPTPNGVIDLETGLCSDGQPDDYMRISCPTTWTGIDTPCPRWERFLQEIFADKPERDEIISFLQRLLGYGISGSTRDHIFSMFYGPQGRNGKDTLFSIFHHVMGELANVVPNDVFLAADHTRGNGSATPHLESLQGMRSAWGSEPNMGDRLDVGQIKHLTGGGDITTRPLYGKAFYRFTPTHKLFMMTNHKLTINANEEPAWERICLLEFGMRFLDNPDPSKSHERPRDTTLIETLKQERSGILAWLVRGCLDWQKQGLNIPAGLKRATRKYQAEENECMRFIDDCGYRDPHATVSATALYLRYKQWHKDTQRGPCMTHNMFGREVLKLFPREHLNSGSIYRGISIGYCDQPTIPSEASTQGDGCDGCDGFKPIFPSSLDKNENNHEENLREFMETAQNPSHPSPEFYPEVEQDTLGLVYEDADISSPPINDYHYTNDDMPTDTYICVEDDLPSSAWDIESEESDEMYAQQDLLRLKDQITCDNCRAQWEDIVTHNDLSKVHYGYWWCDHCTPRYNLMQLAQARGYPELKLPYIEIQSGCVAWLIIVRTCTDRGVTYIKDHLP